jgi:branched-chain amino acid transport system ATP-binding protein
MLTCDRLGAGYGKVRIVWDLSLRVGPGECVALVGKNGMGKSTLLKAIMGVATRQGGTVSIAERDVSAARTHEIVRLGVAYVAQDEASFEDMTVDENLRLGALRVPDYERARDAAIAGFPILGERLGQRVGTLSGGQRKMLLVARALIASPKLVILDEVSEGLQPSVRDALAERLLDYRRTSAASIFIVEQNLQFALRVADRFVVLNGGRIVEEGDAADARAPALIERHMTL